MSAGFDSAEELWRSSFSILQLIPRGKTLAGCKFGLEHHLLRDKRVQAALSHINQARRTDARRSQNHAAFESALMQVS